MEISKLILSVDLDEWYHIRWATGSPDSTWESPEHFFKDVYKSDKPNGDIIDPTLRLLDLLDKYNVKITFFITGEVAGYYPNLIKKISRRGHEIASHSNRHIDLSCQSRESFANELRIAKYELENITGEQIYGFRMPNLIIENWVWDILNMLNFKYDSSICPSRSLKGKFGKFKNYPEIPYKTGVSSFEPGRTDFYEFPIPVFPFLKIPGATGIATRMFGSWWSTITIMNVARKGVASYYFHPYELSSPPENMTFKTLYQKLFCRRTGEWMFRVVENYVCKYRPISCKQYLQANKVFV